MAFDTNPTASLALKAPSPKPELTKLQRLAERVGQGDTLAKEAWIDLERRAAEHWSEMSGSVEEGDAYTIAYVAGRDRHRNPIWVREVVGYDELTEFLEFGAHEYREFQIEQNGKEATMRICTDIAWKMTNRGEYADMIELPKLTEFIAFDELDKMEAVAEEMAEDQTPLQRHQEQTSWRHSMAGCGS